MSERVLVRLAEVALALITLAAVAGMTRLFAGTTWLPVLLLNAAGAHAGAALLRRRGVPIGVSALAMTVGAALAVSWSYAWSTTVVGIPTGETFDVLRHELDVAWSAYQDVVSPTPALTGFLVVSALAIWLIAFVADWAAFRLWVPFESTLPAATLFLFTALLGTEAGREWGVAAYAGALLLFLLVHRLARQEGTSHWVAERRTAGHRSLLTAGVALTTVAVVVGALLGPRLPGADAAGVLDPHDLDGADAPRVTVSPLVDIRTKLVDQANVEVFTVRSTARSYWRLTSLERYDGRIWSSSGSYGKAGRDLPEAVEVDAPADTVRQSFAISNLAAIWLPSAYEPRSFVGEGVDVRYDEDSSTLIVSSKVPDSDGLSYQVTSLSPRLTPADLTGTADQVPQDIREEYEQLPQGFSPRVEQLARDLTAGATTPYEQSRALQDYLRTFTYDLTIGPGHDGDALESFLFNTKRGYCEQFAGAFAAMARAIGLPSRVAVGFSPGQADATQPDLFHVRGENAHAWPEVYFSGAGWVAFEPTPGRGMPDAEAYTGVPEQQAAPGRPTAVVTVPVPEGSSSTTPTSVEGGGDTTTTTTAEDPKDDQHHDRSWFERWILDPLAKIVLGLALLVLVYCAVVSLVLSTHRRRRRARAVEPDQRVDLAWTESMEEMALLGFRERASDTLAERAERLGEVLPTALHGARALVAVREASAYSPGGVGPSEAEAAASAAEEIAAAVREVASRSAQARRWLDPRPLLRGMRRSAGSTRRQIAVTAAVDHEADRSLVDVSPPD